eukprot:scaffold544_cov256-Pinguiococcus_pyrenoidosus.AAC.1
MNRWTGSGHPTSLRNLKKNCWRQSPLDSGISAVYLIIRRIKPILLHERRGGRIVCADMSPSGGVWMQLSSLFFGRRSGVTTGVASRGKRSEPHQRRQNLEDSQGSFRAIGPRRALVHSALTTNVAVFSTRSGSAAATSSPLASSETQSGTSDGVRISPSPIRMRRPQVRRKRMRRPAIPLVAEPQPHAAALKSGCSLVAAAPPRDWCCADWGDCAAAPSQQRPHA